MSGNSVLNSAKYSINNTDESGTYCSDPAEKNM